MRPSGSRTTTTWIGRTGRTRRCSPETARNLIKRIREFIRAIPNAWDRLVERLRKDAPSFRKLSFLVSRRFLRVLGSEIRPVFQGLHHFYQLSLIGGVGVNGRVENRTA